MPPSPDERAGSAEGADRYHDKIPGCLGEHAGGAEGAAEGRGAKYPGCRLAKAAIRPLPMALKTCAVIAAEPPGRKLQIAGMSYTCYNHCSL